jgi:hypothetical protein
MCRVVLLAGIFALVGCGGKTPTPTVDQGAAGAKATPGADEKPAGEKTDPKASGKPPRLQGPGRVYVDDVPPSPRRGVEQAPLPREVKPQE